MSSPLWLCSEDMAPADWIEIARTIDRLRTTCNVRACVVTIGTDTASYAAHALSFLLAGQDVTVVLTGASGPIDEPRGNGRRNVRAAVAAARTLPPSVSLVFAATSHGDAQVYNGVRVRKVAGSGSCFSSVGGGLRGVVSRQGVFRPHQVRDAPSTRAWGAASPDWWVLDERVLTVRCTPGLDFDVLRAGLGRNIRGVVVELYVSGTCSSRGGPTSLPAFVRDAGRARVPVVLTCPRPAAQLGTYESTATLVDEGAISATPMLTEVATVKLMWCLAQEGDVAEMMRTDVAGEHYGDRRPGDAAAQDAARLTA